MQERPTFAFSVDRQLLAAELAVVIKTVEGKTTIPMLANVMIEALSTGRVKITGTDLEVGLISVLAAKVAIPGGYTLPAKKLLDTLRKLPGDTVTVVGVGQEVDDDRVLLKEVEFTAMTGEVTGETAVTGTIHRQAPEFTVVEIIHEAADTMLVQWHGETTDYKHGEPKGHFYQWLPKADVSPAGKHMVTAAVKILAGQVVVKLFGIGRDSFPELPTATESVALKMPTTVMAELIHRTAFAISVEESRFTLNGALLEANGTCAMTATDGHRLARAVVDRKAIRDIKVLIPRKALNLLSTLLDTKKPEMLLVNTDENHLYFCVNDRLLIARKLKGNFPDYERVIPKTNVLCASVDRKTAQSVITRAESFADQRSHAIRIALHHGHIEVNSQSLESAEFTETMPAVYAAAPVEMGLNARYLLDYLHSADEDRVDICLKDGTSAALLKPAAPLKSGMDYLYVVMPMRV